MDYTTKAASAEATLKAKGRSMTLKVVTAGAYDPETGTDPGSSTASYPCWGIKGSFALAQIDGTNIIAGDCRATIGAHSLPVAPQPGNGLMIGEDEWSVVNVDTVSPADVAILHNLHLRRA